MSRTSIPVEETTKEHLDSLKSDDETWDEFFARLTADEEPIAFDVISETEGERVKREIRAGRSLDWWRTRCC